MKKALIAAVVAFVVSGAALAGPSDAVIDATITNKVTATDVTTVSANGGGFGVSVGQKATTNIGNVEAYKGGSIKGTINNTVTARNVVNTNSDVNIGNIRAGGSGPSGSGGSGGGGLLDTIGGAVGGLLGGLF